MKIGLFDQFAMAFEPFVHQIAPVPHFNLAAQDPNIRKPLCIGGHLTVGVSAGNLVGPALVGP